MYKIQILSLLFLISAGSLFAAGHEEGGGSNRGTYLSRGGYIIQPEDIIIDNYLAQYDYEYPLPDEEEFTISTNTGYKNDTGYIQIGVKGQKKDFESLPPLNLTFCIDRSGSMTSMMPWVKNSFYIFINNVRDGDIISLVDMNTEAQTLLAPTIIKTENDRTTFKRLVDKIEAEGGTDVYSGLKKSYEEVKKNYSPEYVNRVIILTDGMHNSGEMINNDILNLAKSNKKMGINVSSIILGLNTSTGLMVDLAFQGGGSSRFVSDHDEMVKIFGTELDRLLIPAAKDIELILHLNEEIRIKNTWGYNYYKKNNTIHYSIPTLHNGDYETILVETEAKNNRPVSIGKLVVRYHDYMGNAKLEKTFNIEYDDQDATADTWTKDSRLLRTEGLLYFCRGLIDISNKTEKVKTLENDLRQYQNPSPQWEDIEQQILLELNQNLSLVHRLKDYLHNINAQTSIEFYEKELEILSNYNDTFNSLVEFYTKKESFEASD